MPFTIRYISCPTYTIICSSSITSFNLEFTCRACDEKVKIGSLCPCISRGKNGLIRSSITCPEPSLNRTLTISTPVIGYCPRKVVVAVIVGKEALLFWMPEVSVEQISRRNTALLEHITAAYGASIPRQHQ